ncbi:DUF72 domain-containing protein [soil metagenome]
MAGRLYVGTSGFAYPDWAPRFYPAGARQADLLRLYAARLPAVELNNTFYQQPRPERVAAWLAATPSSFRFTVKAQRGSSLRGLGERAADAFAWLMPAYRQFGERLGSVLFHVPEQIRRDDARLATLLAAWPPDMPLALEFQHPSWLDDEVLALLRENGAALCATDRDDAPPPDIRLTGPFLYLRLRRSSYPEEELAAWAGRLVPFLADGCDAFVFFRHDADGETPLRALDLLERTMTALSAA